MTNVESVSYSSETLNINFGEDDCGIKSYIVKRLAQNDVNAIKEAKNDAVSPTIYSRLLNC